jgi:hypothetical protein
MTLDGDMIGTRYYHSLRMVIMNREIVLPSLRSCVYLRHTQWSRVLLEKLTGLQLVKNFPAFYGTRRFITAFTSARHLSLS